MCEIFAMTSSKAFDISKRAQVFVTHSNIQPDGWGVAAWEKDASIVYRGSERASESVFLNRRLAYALNCKTAIMHIRRATVGKVGNVNCHPFVSTDDTGRTWTLVHNGTVQSNAQIRPYFAQRAGKTDSEAVLYYLVDCINNATKRAGRPLSAKERFLALDGPITQLAHHNKINLVIYDEEQLYVHVNEKHTLHMLTEEEGITFMTVPFVKEEQCEFVPPNRLLVFKDGAKIFEGRKHFFEFFAWMIPLADLIPKEE